MRLRLLDYQANEYWIEIPDDTEYIEGEIISGDMVLAKPIFFDTGDTVQCTRTKNFFDGEFVIPIKELERFNSLKNSYDVFDLGNKVTDEELVIEQQ